MSTSLYNNPLATIWYFICLMPDDFICQCKKLGKRGLKEIHNNNLFIVILIPDVPHLSILLGIIKYKTFVTHTWGIIIVTKWIKLICYLPNIEF